jgi:flagellar hook protein FlgE
MTGSSALSAIGGIHAWMQAFDRSAASVNAASAQGLDGADVAASSTGDLVDGMVGMDLAETGVRANIAVLRTSDEMLGTLLDMRA